MTAKTKVQTSRPLDDLLVLEHSDRGGEPHGLPTNAYVLIADREALVVDTMFEFLLEPLRALRKDGIRPVGLALTHRHLAGNGDIGFFSAFIQSFDAPLLLHPLDAAHPQSADTGLPFYDIQASLLPARFGIEVIHYPGQTEGSIMLYRQRDGLLLTGDSAMGTTARQARDGLHRVIRPPHFTSVDDAGLRERWRVFDRAVAHIGPLHGTPQFGCDDLEGIMRPLVREAQTVDGTGVAAAQ